MADPIWFAPIKGCQCAVCQRRREELAKADAIEAEWNNLDQLLTEEQQKVYRSRWG